MPEPDTNTPERAAEVEQSYLAQLEEQWAKLAAAEARLAEAEYELTALRRSLSGWLTAADGAGLDEDGIVALFTSALRDFYERRVRLSGRGAAGDGETEGIA